MITVIMTIDIKALQDILDCLIVKNMMNEIKYITQKSNIYRHIIFICNLIVKIQLHQKAKIINLSCKDCKTIKMEPQKLSKKNYKDYIKNSETLVDQYSCGICYDVCIRPMRCSGPCKKMYCMKCVSLWMGKNGQCPLKCSKKFVTEKVHDLKITFLCPYNRQKCTQAIESIKQFQSHYQKCQYISGGQLEVEKYKEEYRCMKGHKLEFFTGSYEQMCNSTCICCDDQKLVRSKCRICDQFYCVECRVPVCSKLGCPVGHAFKYLQINNPSYICDICGVSIILAGQGVRDDPKCNFGICQCCYQDLPQKVESTEIMQIRDDQCDQGHRLQFTGIQQTQSTAKTCYSCRRVKACPRFCSTCAKFYCLKCKNIDVTNKKKCGLGHLFIQRKKQIPIQKSQLAENQKKEDIPGLSLFCQFCEKKQDEVYAIWQDKQCKIKLCNKCLEYLNAKYSDKARFFTDLKCKEKHCLRYFNNDQNYRLPCAECHQLRAIKLICAFCNNNNQKFYCCRCHLPPAGICYLGHKMSQLQENTFFCHICNEQKEKQSYWDCQDCNLSICGKCQQNIAQK